MSFFYPQAVMSLRIRWEDFDSKTDVILTDVYPLIVIAKSVTVNINDYTQADTFTAEIDYKNFPFDPRCIRALGASIHIEDRERLFRPDNRLNIIEPTDDNVMFLGFADEERIEFDDENRIVRFEGRDFTSLLIDTPNTLKAVDLSRPVDVIIQGFLNRLPATEKITVDNRTGKYIPNLGKFSPDYSPLGQMRSGKKKESYWDVIQDIIRLAGLIAYIELDKLVITKPRTLYGNQDVYHFIYGKNLKNLSFKRKLGRQKGINILVRSMNFERKEVLEAKIPLEATNEWATQLMIQKGEQTIDKIDSNGNVKTEVAPYLSFNISNVANKSQLIEIAQSIYEELGRQQIEGNLVTKDMKTIQDKKIFDLTKIRNGTPVSITIDQGDMEGIQRIKDETQREKFLVTRNYPPKVAKAFARTLGKFDTRFYTKAVEFTIDKDSGFELRLDFINFIELDQKGLS